jgi:hypothetical protein
MIRFGRTLHARVRALLTFRQAAVAAGPTDGPIRRLPALGMWLAILLGALLASAATASAATSYVSPGGSGSTCSQAAPCGSLGSAYGKAASGDTVEIAAGVYGVQNVPAGTKQVRFHGNPGNTIRQIWNDASNVTYDGVNVDADGKQSADGAAFELSGDSVTVKNSSIGNVVDEKAMLATGSNHTIDNVVFHDAVLKTDGIHMECLYAIGVPGFTVRNSTFQNCAVMDLFFTYGDWWSPSPPAYGNVTIENNVFGHSENGGNGGWNYYTLYIQHTGPQSQGWGALTGWTVRNNTFEISAIIDKTGTASNSRWVGNVGGWNCFAGVVYSHNVGDKCSSTDKQVSPSASTPSQTAPFGWANPSGGDFHLTASSPAIDSADPNDAPATDRDGRARVGVPDGGSYEFGAGSDTTPPDTTIPSGPANPTTSTSASLAFSSTESGSTFQCKLDAGAYASCTSPKSYSGLSTGSHTFSVRATDAAGNTDASPATWTWTINPPSDTTPPDTTITSGPANPTTSTSASFAFSSSETGSTFECKLDSGAYGACTSPKSYSGLSTGSHAFSVRATDAAGNTDASPATWTWTINPPADTTPPDTTITSGPSNPTTSTSASFAFSSSESGSAFECKLDAGAYGACTSPKSYSGLSTGSHTFSVRATDAAGNTDATPASQTWTINPPADTTPPDTSITAGPSGPTNDATPAFAFASTESGSTFACRVDSGAYGACTSPWTTPALSDGGHSVSVRATDAAGNTDATAATRSFTVDTATPHTTITSSPVALSLSGSGSVSFTADESGATSECRLDGGAWAPCTSPYQVSGLGIGSHTVDVRSTDAAGNVESPGASASWTVLAPVTAAGPAVTLVAPTVDSTVSRSFRFTADATSANGMGRVEFWVDGTRVATDRSAPYSAWVDVKWLKSGMHTMTARAFDSADATASAAALVRVARRTAGVRAAVAKAARRGTLVTTAAAGPNATRVVGLGPKQRMVRVTFTRCDDRKGTVADRTSLRADSHGRLRGTRGRAGLCVLGLALAY